MLPVADGYLALPEKVRLICLWALQQKYDFTHQLDDDVYSRPERLLTSGFEKHDYIGRLRGPSGEWPAPYCSGFSYWLSAASMRAVVAARWNGDTADDRWIGNVLQQAGLTGEFDDRYRVSKCNEAAIAGQKGEFSREDIMVGNAVYGAGLSGVSDYRYRVVNALPKSMLPNVATGGEGPREGNEIISACEFEPAQMDAIHRDFLAARGTPQPELPRGEFSNICVLIKTFLRDEFLVETIRGIEKELKEVKIVVVDDGRDDARKVQLYQKLRDKGHVCTWLQFDAGFGAKSNAGVSACDRPYVLIASDDFQFDDKNIRRHIRQLMMVLEHVPSIGVASGRVDKTAYEFCLELGPNWAQARVGYYGRGNAKGVPYQLCDLTVNFSLVRRELFEKVRWDNDVKIGGGEHGAFYIDVKRAGWKVAHVPGVNISQIKGRSPHPSYMDMRARALNPERPCYLRRGIEHYLNPAGICEMCRGVCRRNEVLNSNQQLPSLRVEASQ